MEDFQLFPSTKTFSLKDGKVFHGMYMEDLKLNEGIRHDYQNFSSQNGSAIFFI